MSLQLRAAYDQERIFGDEIFTFAEEIYRSA
jgi:hypothetical protein